DDLPDLVDRGFDLSRRRTGDLCHLRSLFRWWREPMGSRPSRSSYASLMSATTAPVRATLFTDPACPWAYSARPALARLAWRFGEQIDWQLVLIGLSEDTSRYEAS